MEFDKSSKHIIAPDGEHTSEQYVYQEIPDLISFRHITSNPIRRSRNARASSIETADSSGNILNRVRVTDALGASLACALNDFQALYCTQHTIASCQFSFLCSIG